MSRLSAFTLGAPHRHCELQGQRIPLWVQRSARRSVGLQIVVPGVLLTLPQHFPLYRIEEILQEKSRWILTRLADPVRQAPPLVAGGTIDWLGVPHVLCLGALRSQLRTESRELALATCDAAPMAIAHALERLMRREAKPFLAQRLHGWSLRLGFSYRGFCLSGAGGRWGSCSSLGDIRLNWRLMQTPLPVLDYVTIHELCHLRELNHSPRFWALVAQACPDWKTQRDWLKREEPRYFSW